MQKNAYVPGALNVRPRRSRPLSRFGVVHAGSSVYVAVCGTESLLVHAMTSPTLAVIVAGSKATPVIAAATVPAPVDGAHDGATGSRFRGSRGLARRDAARRAGAGSEGRAAIANVEKRRRFMGSSWACSETASPIAVVYVHAGRAVS